MSDSDDLVQRDAAVFFHQEGSSPCIAGIRHLSGMWIEDLDGTGTSISTATPATTLDTHIPASWPR